MLKKKKKNSLDYKRHPAKFIQISKKHQIQRIKTSRYDKYKRKKVYYFF